MPKRHKRAVIIRGYTVEIIKIVAISLLALVCGIGVARQGVARGNITTKAGAIRVNIFGRVVVADFINFRDGLIFYRLAVLPTGSV